MKIRNVYPLLSKWVIVSYPAQKYFSWWSVTFHVRWMSILLILVSVQLFSLSSLPWGCAVYCCWPTTPLNHHHILNTGNIEKIGLAVMVLGSIFLFVSAYIELEARHNLLLCLYENDVECSVTKIRKWRSIHEILDGVAQFCVYISVFSLAICLLLKFDPGLFPTLSRLSEALFRYKLDVAAHNGLYDILGIWLPISVLIFYSCKKRINAIYCV